MLTINKISPAATLGLMWIFNAFVQTILTYLEDYLFGEVSKWAGIFTMWGFGLAAMVLGLLVKSNIDG